MSKPQVIHLKDLPSPVIENILQRLCDYDIATLHVASNDTFHLCYEYLRHGREGSRSAREKYVQRKYNSKLHTVSRLVGYKLREAYSDLIRRQHSEIWPAFYTLCIDIDRLNAKEISSLVANYGDVFTYLLRTKNTDPDLEIPHLYLHLGYRILEKFHRKKVDYHIIFEVLSVLRNFSPCWAHSQEDITNQNSEQIKLVNRESTLRPYSLELSLRIITINI